MHHRLVLLFLGVTLWQVTTLPGESGILAPLPARLTQIEKNAIFSNWTHFKQTDADQSHALSASVAEGKLTISTSSEQAFRSYTAKEERTYSVNFEDLVGVRRFGKVVVVQARAHGVSVHSVSQRIHDRSKTLLEDSRLDETRQCADFSFSFEGSAQPEVLAGEAAEDIINYVQRRKTNAPEPLAGKWEWGYYNGALAQWTTLGPDGIATSTNNTRGHWHVVNELERIYEIKWDVHGWVNVVHLSPDHRALVEDYYNRGLVNSRKRADGN